MPPFRAFAISAVSLATAAVAPPPMAARQADVDRAMASVRQRAASGEVVAQFSLGSILYYGTPQTAEAIEWIRRAAAKGLPDAEFQLGQIYEAGFGIVANETEALSWYRRAADHGSPAAQRTLGDFCLKGRTGPPDVQQALLWFSRAAAGDDLQAQYQLAQLYFSSEGIPRDYVSAWVWFTIAAGQTPLADNRTQLRELANVAAVRMSPEQLVEARRRVAAWRPAPYAR